ncbi:protein C [Sulfuritortus calidifontis]|uniref:Protein C n=1 Tax=Sulfuritortus calidifontis TaxID=1914471 RepID=A0A4R3JVF8_9PROT|nr:S49 family peptidase [Sulfuritortus calidifontis]TCS71988.1 protein C [Sulfuritortus calidifontis]
MLPHLAARLFSTPLLVQRAKLDLILAVLSDRLNLAAPDVELAPPLPKASNPAAFPERSIAVIPIHGTLVKRTLGLEAASGLMSYAEIGARLEAALGDPQVAGIVLDIDSPGGETGGCFELARRVREAAAVKPIWAVANDAAFSAAYAIGCAAQRLFVTETGGVGSIGVIALHVDQSVKDTQEGLRYTAITAGARKNDYSPHAPLADAARAALQAEVDRLHALFVAHVAAMRGLDEDVVRATEAALFFGPQAVEAHLADGVAALPAVLTEFDRHLAAARRPSSPPRHAPTGKATLPRGTSTMTDSPSDAAPEPLGADAAAALVAEARREATQSAQAIVEMCLIAGVPDRAAEFIAAGRTDAEVRRALLEARAERSKESAVRSTHGPQDWGAPGADPAASPVVAAVKKLVTRE